MTHSRGTSHPQIFSASRQSHTNVLFYFFIYLLSRYIRDLSYDEKDEIKKLAEETYKVADEHDLENNYLPFGSAYRDAEKLKAALAGKEKA